MKYSTYLSVNDQFKNSINIEYDLTSYNKLSKYIPTEDACEIFRYYLSSIKDNSINRATILEGPYGKGKSYLLLTLLQLLYLDINNENVKEFLSKLKEVDFDLVREIKQMKKEGVRLLPVIINSNYSHLPQALNLALKESLSNEHLDKLLPGTAFDVSLHIIDKWKKDKEIKNKVIVKCLEKTGKSLVEIEKGLLDNDQRSYEDFVNLYNCVVKGLEFNPFTHDDVVKNYLDISNSLKTSGFTGMFVVFDEFSKFIEAENDSLSNDLKVLQDFAEAASRTGEYGQLHMCCITHKSLNNYYNNKDEITTNLFRTVEGRFKELRFNRSLNQNYQIISFTLSKKENFDKMFEKYYTKNKYFYEKVYSLQLFDDSAQTMLSKNCFPLNPLTTFSAIYISELVAQNERTLFTFISDNDNNSLSTFIKTNSSGLLNVDKVYDYFEPLLEKSNEGNIKKLNYKAQTCISKVTNELSKRLIKIICIIKVINDDRLLTNADTLSIALDVNESDALKCLNTLIENKILKKSFSDDTYDFALANSKLIDQKVDAIMSSKSKKENLSAVLNTLFVSEFVLPRKYNTKHKMTRFYREKYISDFELLNMTSFELFFKNEFSDGYIFNVINLNGKSAEIKKHFDTMDDNKNIILKIENQYLEENIKSEIYRINALRIIKNDPEIDEIIKDEISLIIEDESMDLESIIKDKFNTNNIELYSVLKNHNYLELLSDLFEKQYSQTPIINIEMINKEFNVSTQYIKARNIVANLFITKRIDDIENYSLTSPERTVFNSVTKSSDINERKILDLIKSYIIKSESKKICCKDIVTELKNSPYGTRNGVLPLLFAMSLSELNENIIFYFDSIEIDLNADNINKMVENSGNYYFKEDKGSTDKLKYMHDFISVFGLTSTNNYNDDVKNIVNTLHKWFLSLPRIIRNTSIKDNPLELDESFIRMKSICLQFDLNANEVLFEKLPDCVSDGFSNVVLIIKKYHSNAFKIINTFVVNLSDKLKRELNCSKRSSLINIFNDWIVKNDLKNRMLSDNERSFVLLFQTKDYDDVSIMNKISMNILKIMVTDWDRDNTDILLDEVKKIIFSAPTRRKTQDVLQDKRVFDRIANSNKSDIPATGKLLENNIEEILDEFGDSLTTEQKIFVLSEMIKKML